jgi:hypothetical protein
VTFPSTPPTGDTEASQFTKPLRELAAFVLLAGNAVLLFLSITSLIFVVDGWASEFGRRAADTYYGFVGQTSILVPLIAMLIATHIRPPVRHARTITLAALAEFLVSAFFGVVTFIGAFAEDVANGRGSTVRFIFENLITRTVWLAFFALAGYVVWRVAIGCMRRSGPFKPRRGTKRRPPRRRRGPRVGPPCRRHPCRIPVQRPPGFVRLVPIR